MFGNSKRLEKMEKTILELQKRVESLESECYPFRVWESEFDYFSPYRSPHTVPVREAIRLVMDHLGLEMRKVDAVPVRTKLVKKEKHK